MKGKQMSLMDEVDRYEQERERRKTEETIRRLDEKYQRLDEWAAMRGEIPAGTVVIIGQNLFRNGHYTMHFYRTVLDYHASCAKPTTPHMVEQQTEEWPDVPPWADTVGHVGEARDIGIHTGLLYWNTGEVTEPIPTWWMKEWERVKQIGKA